MSDFAVTVEGLSKMYRIGRAQPRYRTMRDSLVETGKAPFRRAAHLLRGQAYGAAGLHETLWALKDVSFEIKAGEVLGVIGGNGAGKTTLLKVLSRITEPTEGAVDLYGRVGSLLEVGTGFHPELTGRENTYLNGAILGMRREEIDRKFDEIVDFSEIEKFIDTPVKHYSSGMYVRLAFSVAAHLEPEILLVDEVLAVGDAAFQKKCLGKMGSVATAGRTVVYVSHNLPSVSNLCTRALWLDSGTIVKDGETATVVSSYLRSSDEPVADLAARRDRSGSGVLRIQGAWLTDGSGKPVSSVESGGEVVFNLRYAGQPGKKLRNVNFSVVVSDLHGQRLFALATRVTGQTFDELSGSGVLACRIASLPLVADTYSVRLSSSVNRVKSDSVEDALRLKVSESDFYGAGIALVKRVHGTFLVPHSWDRAEADGDIPGG